MLNYKEKLKELTNVLLEPEHDYKKLFDTIDDLSKLFIKVSDLDMDHPENRNDVYLPTGKAIGTVWAAMCVKEIMRTKQLIRGVYKGILSALNKFQNRPIHILYAGTGPFATLALPMTTLFTHEEINFTFLEINEKSIELLEKAIEVFEAKEYVKNIIKCDATKFKANKNDTIHMIISETMNRALEKEPHVAIAINLVPQMVEGGILVPQNIIIDAGLLNHKKNTDRMLNGYNGKYYHTLETIFQLNKISINDYFIAADNQDIQYSFPIIEVDIPKDMIEMGYTQLNLFTKIQVFEDIFLTNYQCSLNLPRKIVDINMEKAVIPKIKFQYQISENPGFKVSVKKI